MRYLGRRLGHAVLLLIGVSILTFLFAELAPGVLGLASNLEFLAASFIPRRYLTAVSDRTAVKRAHDATPQRQDCCWDRRVAERLPLSVERPQEQ